MPSRKVRVLVMRRNGSRGLSGVPLMRINADLGFIFKIFLLFRG